MFNATGQSGVLFGNTKSLNLFGQNQNQVTGFFGASTTNLVNGTTIKYVPLNGTDTIQKNNQTVNVSTKLNCISAMKEYEMKSLEELRLEDYTANRISPKSNAPIFSSNQPALFNNQSSLFQNSSPFGSSSTQQTGLGTITTQSSLFGASNNQTNAFGTKNLFANSIPTSISTNSAFGSFNNNQSKPSGTLFGASSTQNKPFFGAATQQPIQSTSLFGSQQQQQQTSSSSLFGNQTQPSLFGGLQSQQQPNQLFNANTSTSSFGFQSQPTTGGLFGSNNTAAKPFGAPNTSFSFASSNTSTNPTLFGNTTAQTGGLFSQNTNNNPVFGSTSKPSLFSNTNTFTTPASSQSQSIFPQTNNAVTGFGQVNNNIFGNQQKPNNQTPFGTASAFNNNNITQKPSLFGNTVTNTGFGGQTSSLFGNFGSNTQPFGSSSSTITTSTMMPLNNNVNTGLQIGITTREEAAFQQQLAQQRVLSLVGNRPYGINKLFMGQNMLTNLDTKASGIDANNTNVLSVAIKRSETENVSNRRRILNQKTKINPGQVNNVFSGFDEDEDLSIKSNKFDNFMIKRDDWKYLPPNAFEKSRKSLISNNSFNNANNLTPDRLGNVNSSSRLTSSNQIHKESTVLSDNSFRQIETYNLSSPIYNGRTSPVYKASFSKAERLINNNNENEEQPIKSKEVKEESLISSPSVLKPADISSKLNEENSPKKCIIDEIDKEDDDNDGDESIYGDATNNCQIILTKEGYSTCPTIENLNQLVNGTECWVKNFEIKRKNYGSIKFPGYTDVYGLNLDETVNILHKEVSVYPDEKTKPEEGNGLNKQAHITLVNIFPIDKSTGAAITDCSRLKMMNFEERIKKVTHKIGARFISYQPIDGVWMFEVEHFSKYAYFESEDEDNNNNGEGENEEEIVEDLTEFDRNIRKKNPPVEFKKETLTKPIEKENMLKSRVVSSEADSMSQIEEIDQKQFRYRSALDGLSFNSKYTFQPKQLFYNYESDEDVTSSGLFHNENKPINIVNKLEPKECDKYQPLFKKFETSEMGEMIYNSRMDCSTISLDVSMANKLIDMEENNRRPIKPLASECVASTLPVNLNQKVLQKIYIPQHLRDIRLLKMPYLPDKFLSYFDSITADIHQKCSNNVALIQGNRFRVGFHVSRDKNSLGLKFFKINSSHENDTLSFRNMHKRNDLNSIILMKCKSNLSDYQEKLLESAFYDSKHSIDSDSKCPFWSPCDGLGLLNSYLNVHNKMQTPQSNEKHTFGRIFNLCDALWNSLGVEQVPGAIQDLCRKQTLSKWIRMQCRERLVNEVDTIMKSAVINSDKCNTLILNAICCGEINLACKLAILTNQHRLSLLISQAAGNLQIRDLLKEQLNQWLQTRVDLHMPPNLLCIYLLLSGQTSSVLSDGSILAPFKHLNWVQSFGCHFWYIQSYLGSIKSAVEMYDDSFKTELDIPLPFPVDSEQDTMTIDDDIKYYDVCYHLIKLYCDRLYDLDVLLNPPTISNDESFKLCWNWSASWHLANILTSLGYSKNISPKISTEWAAQLEREGMWKMAAFVILHIPDLKIRIHLVKSLISRQIKESKDLNEEEKFLVDNLLIPIEWIHEAKAVYCKALGNLELEAYHWFKSGQYEKSYQLYVEYIIPKLLINDKFEGVKEILYQFTNSKSDRVLANWPIEGDVYLKYISIVTTLRTFKLTNKLVNYSCLVENGEMEHDIYNVIDKDVNEDIVKLKLKINDLSKAVNEFKVNNETQRICKQQFQSLCNRCAQINEMF